MRHTIEDKLPGAFATLALALAALAPQAAAQSSASYTIAEHAFNAGGNPAHGTILVSIGFRVTLDSLGDTVVGPTLSSGGFRVDGGFMSAYPPPGEVTNLRFSADKVTLSWNPEASAGDYNLYRDLLSALSGLGYGQCEQSAIAGTSTTHAGVPPAGAGYFYLVTARNRLREEGTKGFGSSGAERPNSSPCP